MWAYMHKIKENFKIANLSFKYKHFKAMLLKHFKYFTRAIFWSVEVLL